MEPNWLQYLDKYRQEELRVKIVDLVMDSKPPYKIEFTGYDRVRPEVELLIQILKEIRKVKNGTQ